MERRRRRGRRGNAGAQSGEPRQRTDGQTAAGNAALGFGPPESSRLPVAGSPCRSASTAHQTRGRDRNFPPADRLPPGRPPASASRRLPLYGKPSPDRTPPCSRRGLGFTLGSPVLPEHRRCYLSFPSVLGAFLPPLEGSPTSPQVFCPTSESPSGERRLPRQCSSRKGRFVTDSSQGSCRIQRRSAAGSESPEPQPAHRFTGRTQAVGSWLKRTGYMFVKQFYWCKLLRAFPLSLMFPLLPFGRLLIGRLQAA